MAAIPVRQVFQNKKVEKKPLEGEEGDEEPLFVHKSAITAKKEASLVTDKMMEELEEKWEETLRKMEEEEK